MKLISMTDFVLEHKEWGGNILSDACIKYANFLKQPLTLDMFIGDESLFDGFSLLQKEGNQVVYLDEYIWFFKDYLSDGYLIESLIEYDLTLTQHAIKQLGL